MKAIIVVVVVVVVIVIVVVMVVVNGTGGEASLSWFVCHKIDRDDALSLKVIIASTAIESPLRALPYPGRGLGEICY